MHPLFRKLCYFIIGLMFAASCLAGTAAQGDVSDQTPPATGAGGPVGAEQKSTFTDEELATLLTRVDRSFVDQDMASFTVDVNLYRDPSNRLNSENIRESNPSDLAGLSTIVSHYTYCFPDYYQLVIMGEVLAGSDVPPDRTFYSQLIPMPGAPIFMEDIRSRFTIRYEGIDEVDGIRTYRIRYTSLDRDTEFFDYLVYYIDIERSVILRIEGAYDNYWYVGTAEGNFYYDNWLGKYLPIYAHGSVLIYPNRRLNLWAKWYRWDWQTQEEIAAQNAGDASETGGQEAPPESPQ